MDPMPRPGLLFYMASRSVLATCVVLAVVACAPRAPSLAGTIAPVRVPRAELALVHQKIVFRWAYSDNEYRFGGEGVARTAPPDSARLDFFLDGGAGGGSAVLVGNDLRVPGAGGGFIRNFLPPTPLLWATLGRLALPAERDTIVRIDGDTLRADIGQEPKWRVAFVSDQLRRLELIESGRLEQTLARDTSGRIRYDQPRGRRRLEMTVLRVDTVPAFDATIWR